MTENKLTDKELASKLDDLLREARMRHDERWTALEIVAMQEVALKMNKIAREAQKKCTTKI